MSWEQDLFAVLDDLEAQAESAYDFERVLEVADRGRAEYARVSLMTRLMAALGEHLPVEIAGVGVLRGTLERVGRDWLLLRGGLGTRPNDWIIPVSAVVAVDVDSPRSVPEVAWSPLQSLSWGSVLRRVADAGSRCVIHHRDGSQRIGTVRRVGADFLEFGDESARPLLVTYASISALRSREGEN